MAARGHLLKAAGLLAAVLLAACAQPQADAGKPAAAVAAPAAGPFLVAPSDGDVFEARGDGSVRHRQSGAVCPAAVGGLRLAHLAIYPMAASRGGDVSCGYGGFPKGAITLYLVKPGDYRPPLSFRQYAGEARAEVRLAHPEATPLPPPDPRHAPGPDGRDHTPSIDAWRLPVDGQSYLSLLYLDDVAPWIVMVRATGDADIGAAADEAWRAALAGIGR